MAKIKDIMLYILQSRPNRSMSNAQLTKMVYLSDWRNAIENGKQISEIKWYFDNFGPFVWDVHDEAKNNPDLFNCDDSFNMYDNRKIVKLCKGASYTGGLTDDEKASLDHTIKATANLSWPDFITLVYSTHPVLTSERYTYFDLLGKAAEYNTFRKAKAVAK